MPIEAFARRCREPRMDISADVLTLCTAAGKILAGRMLGDLWDATRTRFSKVLTTDVAPRYQDRLDRDHKSLSSAPEDERTEIAETISASWTTRLQDLLED